MELQWIKEQDLKIWKIFSFSMLQKKKKKTILKGVAKWPFERKLSWISQLNRSQVPVFKTLKADHEGDSEVIGAVTPLQVQRV